MFIKKEDFVIRVTELMSRIKRYSSSLSFLLIFNFLRSNAPNSPQDTSNTIDIPLQEIKKNLQKFATEQFPDTTRTFIDNQMALISIMLTSIQPAEDLDLEALKPTLLGFFERYIDSQVKADNLFNVPLLFSLMQRLDQEHTFYKIYGFFAEIVDRNTLTMIKDEVKKYFDARSYKKIFVEVAKRYTDRFSRSQLDSILEGETTLIGSGGLDQSFAKAGQEDFSGIEWVIDEESSFESALRMGLQVLRRMMLARSWTSAANFSQSCLSKIITQNSLKISRLTEAEEDLEVKSMVREKEILTKILDVIGMSHSVIQASVSKRKRCRNS